MSDFFHQIASLVILLLGSIGGAAAVKKLLVTLIKKASDTAAADLPHLGKVVVGYVVSFAFIILVQAGIIPLPDSLKSSFNQLQTYLLPLVAKAIYDFVNDLAKGKPAA